MSNPPNTHPTDDQGGAEHTHHWMIGDQEGPSSPAVCKDCGERREFSNSFVHRKPPWSRARPAQEAALDDTDGNGGA
jgi:hypothetical protein